MQLSRICAPANLAILSALAIGIGATTAHAQIIEVRETEASSCLEGRTGDNPDPRSSCPDESKTISAMLIRPGERARMTIQQRSYAACKTSEALGFGRPTYPSWRFPYTEAPCQWDVDRVDFPVPEPSYNRWIGKQLCARWIVRNPTSKELKVEWAVARTDVSDLNRTGQMVIRNNIDKIIEPGIAETTRIDTCLNPVRVGVSNLGWPEVNGLMIRPVPPFPASVLRGTSSTDRNYPNQWAYWYLLSGNYNPGGSSNDSAVVDFYTETMRDWALQTGEVGGRYFVHLERAWIKDVATGTVFQEL